MSKISEWIAAFKAAEEKNEQESVGKNAGKHQEKPQNRPQNKISYEIRHLYDDTYQITVPAAAKAKIWKRIEGNSISYEISGRSIGCTDRSDFVAFELLVEKYLGWPNQAIRDESYSYVDSDYYDLDDDDLPDYGIMNDVMWGTQCHDVSKYSAHYPSGQLHFENKRIELSSQEFMKDADKSDDTIVRIVTAFVEKRQK